jgi:UDP-2-acetamido-3-amino-2,3-dideoxy-glucuronate N-acetyltransferase
LPLTCLPAMENGLLYLWITNMSIFIHPTAIVDEGAQIGEGSHIWHWVHVSGGARIGKGCSLGQNVYVGNRVIIGDNVKIQNNVSIYDNVVIEDDVFCGPSMVFTNVVNPRSHVSRKHEYKDTIVRQGATLGANCTIVCGHTIGEYAFVGAGAVVTRNVLPYTLVVGTPARRLGWICQCGARLPENSAFPKCNECGEEHRLSSGMLHRNSTGFEIAEQ